MRPQTKETPASQANTEIPEGCAPADAMALREGNFQLAQENHFLRQALRFYANGEHWVDESGGKWDTVSGEPQNWWWRENDDDAAEGVEDGTIAKRALLGQAIDWDGEEPDLIAGEYGTDSSTNS